jgi:hypothetical protein
LNLICNYANNETCMIYDGQFYNYYILIDYYNYYYNNTNEYNVYLLNNKTYCSFNNPNKHYIIVMFGLCLMIITTILFVITCCYYYKPQIKQHIHKNKYIRISDNPPEYSP